MNFDLSEEQRLLQSTIDGFLENEFPVNSVREFYDGAEELDRNVWKGLAELGVLGLHLPEEFGGAGLEMLDLQCVAERLGYHATPGPFFGHAIAGLAIAIAGSDAQQKKWLPQLASGDCIASIALAESEGRWQPDEWGLGVNVDGTLSGTKLHVPCGRSAGLLVVGVDGGRLGLVDVSQGGVTLTPARDLDRTRRLATIEFAQARFDLLPNGAAHACRLRDAGLVLLAADAVGGAARCVELAVSYANQREQFGQTIGHFQALKHQLADLALDAEPCRSLAWYAAYAWDHIPEEAARAAAHAKSHITERFLKVARGTVEAHGGIGYTWECEVHYWLKRAVLDRTFLGSPRVHRLRAADLAGW
jgi:alkylation response protein AidB-like acyl-CoA dehydrogenase